LYLNEAIVEHAKVGVTNHSSDGLPHQSTGGMIFVTKTLFVNNIRAASLVNYQLKSMWQNHYKAHFAQCVFDINDDYKGAPDYPFESHVYLSDIDGPLFQGCDFYNHRTVLSKGEGVGIYSKTYAGFRMTPICNSLSTPCTDFTRNRF